MRRATRRTRARRWRKKFREDANCWAQMRRHFVARTNERSGDIGHSRDERFLSDDSDEFMLTARADSLDTGMKSRLPDRLDGSEKKEAAETSLRLPFFQFPPVTLD